MNVKEIVAQAVSLGTGIERFSKLTQDLYVRYLNQAHFDLYALLAPVNFPAYLVYDDKTRDDPEVKKVFFVQSVCLQNSIIPLEKALYQDLIEGDPFLEQRGDPRVWYHQEQGDTWTIHLYPVPERAPEEVKFRVYYVPSPKLLKIEQREEEIPYPSLHHSTLVDGLMYYIIQSDQGFNNSVDLKIYLDRWEKKKAALLASYQMSKQRKFSTFSEV